MQATRSLLGSTILAGVVSGLLVTPALAQSVQLGVEAGASFAKFVGSDTDGASGTITRPFGALTFVAHKPASMVGFQSGLSIVTKGTSVDEGGAEGSFRLRYLELPLLVRFAPASKTSTIVPALVAGAVLGARIGCDISAVGDGASGSLDCDSDLVRDLVDFKRFDAGLAIGAEVAFPFRKSMLVVPMIRYTRGLTNVGDSGGSSDNINNQVIYLGVGLRFRR